LLAPKKTTLLLPLKEQKAKLFQRTFGSLKKQSASSQKTGGFLKETRYFKNKTPFLSKSKAF
jgi:hypothetical protein